MFNNAESAVRRKARRYGYSVKKSRAACSFDNMGDYMLVDVDQNFVVLGGRFDASLEEISAFLTDR
jgi:hypothetical protein